MSGITGCIGLRSFQNIEFSSVIKMAEAINHRGCVNKCLLSIDIHGKKITDCYNSGNCENNSGDFIVGYNWNAERQNKPYYDIENGLVVLCDGVITNRDSLKRIQEQEFVYSELSHANVFGLLYREYGLDQALEMIDGRYAIVLVDLFKEQVFMIKDRLGSVPLYYAIVDQVLIFGSEQKSLFCYNGFMPHINEYTLPEFVLFRSPLYPSLFANVKAINAGSYISIKDSTIDASLYFTLDKYERMSETDISFNQAKTLFLDVLCQVLKSQRNIMCSICSGLALSGGIDSSFLALCESRVEESFFDNCYIVSVEDKDEHKYSHQVASKYTKNLLSFIFNGQSAFECFGKTIWHLDSINSHFNALGLIFLSQQLRKRERVLFGGEGADELGGGYYQFAEGKSVSRYLQSKNYNSIIDEDYFGRYPRTYGSFALSKDMNVSETTACSLFNFDKDIINRSIYERISLFDSYRGSDFDKHLKYEAGIHLQDLLIKQDKMAMANGMSIMLPYTDLSVIKLFMTLPEAYWIHQKRDESFTGKYIMKKAIEEEFGADFAYRKKMGFPMPIKKYMSTPIFKDLVWNELIPDIEKKDFFNYHNIYHIYKNLDNASPDEVVCLWKVFNLMRLCQLFDVN